MHETPFAQGSQNTDTKRLEWVKFQIWKFPLEVKGKPSVVEMPVSAHVIHVAMQQGVLCLWAEVAQYPNGNKTEMREFFTIGTGWEFTKEHVGEYIGTVHNGLYVWHIYEGKNGQ